MTFRTVLAILAFSTFFFPFSARAIRLNISIASDAAGLAAQIPRELIELKVKRVGDLDLEKLAAELESTRSIIFGSLALADIPGLPIDLGGVADGADGTMRAGAECYSRTALREWSARLKLTVPTERLVLVNRLSPLRQPMDEAMTQQLLLHEGLCAFYGRKRDLKYQMSASLLFALTLSDDERAPYLKSNKWNFLAPFRNLQLARIEDVAAKEGRLPAGGVTGGTGGGDPWAANAKWWLMFLLHLSEKSCRTDASFRFGRLTCSQILPKMRELWERLRDLDIESAELHDSFDGRSKPYYRLKKSGVLLVQRDSLALLPAGDSGVAERYRQERAKSLIPYKNASYKQALIELAELWIKNGK